MGNGPESHQAGQLYRRVGQQQRQDGVDNRRDARLAQVDFSQTFQANPGVSEIGPAAGATAFSYSAAVMLNLNLLCGIFWDLSISPWIMFACARGSSPGQAFPYGVAEKSPRVVPQRVPMCQVGW
jgi:hypothetical protein